MNRRAAVITGVVSLGVIVAAVAALAAWPGGATFEDPETISARSTPEEAYPGLIVRADRTSQVLPGRNVVLEVSCPAGPAAMECAAGASRAAAIWFDRHGEGWGGRSHEAGKVEWLLVNVVVSGLGVSSGPQLIGKISPVADLETADVAGVLERFRWNGSGYQGEVPAAEWCGDQPTEGAFCASFRAEACPGAPLKEPPVQRFCSRPRRT